MRRLLQRRWARDVSCLVLLLCVIAMTPMVAPLTSRLDARSHLATCNANLKNIGTALEMYSVDNGGRFPGWNPRMPCGGLSRLVPNYLDCIPTCPAAGLDTYSDSYVAGWSPDEYALTCQGRWHGDVGLEEDLPRYSSVHGLDSLGNPHFTCATKGPFVHLPRDPRVCGIACGMSRDEVEAALGRGHEGGARSWTFLIGGRDDEPCTVSFDDRGGVRSVQGGSVSLNGRSWKVTENGHGDDLVRSLGPPTAVFRTNEAYHDYDFETVRWRRRYTDEEQKLSVILYGAGRGYDSYEWVQLRSEP